MLTCNCYALPLVPCLSQILTHIAFSHSTYTYIGFLYNNILNKFQPATQRKAAAGGGGRAGGSSNILQFYTDDSPGLQVGPTTVLVASLSFVGVVVLLHIWGKFRM
mmetsp:Transcript_14221/g.29022  ORF Transcript_14221/g.29022 Transcript_14221/m.29022 type:complete len:106 (-) Transcript_14221:264-581(-)